MNRGQGIFDQIEGWQSARIASAKVLVVGAGALGNEVLKNLALLGVGQIILLDFDRVEPHNLSRSVLFRPSDAEQRAWKVDAAAQALLQINPDLSILTLKGDVQAALGLGLLRRVDVAIGCLDNRLARLYLNRLCWKAGIPWVDGGILQLSGQATTYVPGHSCYECQLGVGEWQEIRTRMGCADMQRRYASAGLQATTPLAASIIGAVQVQEAMRLLHTPVEARTGGEMFSYEGQQLHAATYTRRGLQAECLSHFAVPDVHPMPELSHESLLGEALALLGKALGLTKPALMLPNGVIVEVAGAHDAQARGLILPRPYLTDALAQSMGLPTDTWVGVPRGGLRERAGQDFPGQDLPLWRLGIPYGDWVEVRGKEGRFWVELGADLAALSFGKGIGAVPNPWLDRDVFRIM